MKKNLEKKILEKIYQFEAERTIIEILLKSSSFIFLSLAIFIFGSVLYEILVEQDTFDLLEIFTEDFEVVRKYFFENISFFFFELPKVLLIILLILLSLFIFLFLKAVKNFTKIKNRVKSLLKYRGE